MIDQIFDWSSTADFSASWSRKAPIETFHDYVNVVVIELIIM